MKIWKGNKFSSRSANIKRSKESGKGNHQGERGMFGMEVEVKCFFVDANDSGALLERAKAISVQYAAIKVRLKCGFNGKVIKVSYDESRRLFWFRSQIRCIRSITTDLLLISFESLSISFRKRFQLHPFIFNQYSRHRLKFNWTEETLIRFTTIKSETQNAWEAQVASPPKPS